MIDLSFILAPSNLSFGKTNLDLILDGWRNTVLAFAASGVLAGVIGVPLGVLRSMPSVPGVQRAISIYVETFRNIPLLVQLFMWFFVLPEIVPSSAGTWLKRELPQPEYWTLVFALGVFMSVRVTELVRAGIQSIDQGQVEASGALGLNVGDLNRFVLWPQAIRIVLPPMTTEFTNCLKATSVGLTIGYIELTQRAREISEQTFRTFEIFACATFFYMLSILVIVLGLLLVERALRIPGFVAPGQGG